MLENFKVLYENVDSHIQNRKLRLQLCITNLNDTQQNTLQQKHCKHNRSKQKKMESDETFIQKTFQMINELTGFVSFTTIKVLYLPNTREINISRAITDIHNNGTNLTNSLVFYLDSYKRLFVHVGTFPFSKNLELLLKFQLFLDTTIKIRYRKLSGPNSPKSEKKQSAPPAPKKRSRVEKSIEEVRQIVTKWRDLFQATNNDGKKLYTLQSAAQKLGMQKKTLDDYYYKIKNAQAYGFDFQKNKKQKIGVLRRFVKDCVKNNKAKSNITSFGGGINHCGSKHSNLGFSPSYGNSYPPHPQKPPEDQIDKYFAEDAGDSSSSDQSDRSD